MQHIPIYHELSSIFFFLPVSLFHKPIVQCDCKTLDVFVVFSSDISLLERNCFSCLYPALLLLCNVG